MHSKLYYKQLLGMTVKFTMAGVNFRHIGNMPIFNITDICMAICYLIEYRSTTENEVPDS